MSGEQKWFQRAVLAFPNVYQSPGVDLGDRQRRIPTKIESEQSIELLELRTRAGTLPTSSHETAQKLPIGGPPQPTPCCHRIPF